MNMFFRFCLVFFVLFTAGCATTGGLEYRNDADNRDLDKQLEESFIAYREGRLGDAESLLLKVLDRHPRMSEAWFKLANIYYRTSQYDAAVRAYEKTITYDPENARAWYNLALTRIKQADVVLQAGISRIRPDSPHYGRLENLRKRLKGRLKRERRGGAS